MAAPPSRESLAATPVTSAVVLEAWWPLAASWLLMGLEVPVVSAVVARLPEATISLAAYGGVVMPLSLLIEAPIIMLLAASTALARDLPSYRVGARFMWIASLVLTALHGLVAFTPLYDLIVAGLLHPPPEVREPARLGLRIMTPWTLAIAYRRYQQGVLIRFGHSRAVGIGTTIRLLTIGAALGAGAALGTVAAIVVGATATVLGVIAEALYAGFAVRPVLAGPVRAVPPPPPGEALTMARFVRFYLPLSLTPLFLFATMPLAAAAMGRMPRPLESLAAWPALNGLVLSVRASGFALTEVVVSLLDRPGASAALRRFARRLALATTLLLLVLAATPLGRAWFTHVAGLPPALVVLAATSLWLALPVAGATALQSLHQGTIVHARRTRYITESVLVLLLTTGAVLGLGVAWGGVPGLYVAMVAAALGNLAQLGWLHRCAHLIASRPGSRSWGDPGAPKSFVFNESRIEEGPRPGPAAAGRNQEGTRGGLRTGRTLPDDGAADPPPRGGRRARPAGGARP